MKLKPYALFLFAVIAVSCQKPLSSDDQLSAGTVKVTIMYPRNEGSTFDMDYYSNQHMTMLSDLFDGIMLDYKIDLGTSGRTAEEPAPFMAIGYLYFNSLSEYQSAFGPNAEKILNDIPNYTNIQPVVQISEVIK